MKNVFTKHPNSVGESYGEHFIFAFRTGCQLVLWGLIAMLHGIFPFLFETYVSERIKVLYHKITQRSTE